MKVDKMRLCWSRVGPYSNISDFCKKRKYGHRGVNTGKCPVKMKAEMRGYVCKPRNPSASKPLKLR